MARVDLARRAQIGRDRSARTRAELLWQRAGFMRRTLRSGDGG